MLLEKHEKADELREKINQLDKKIIQFSTSMRRDSDGSRAYNFSVGAVTFEIIISDELAKKVYSLVNEGLHEELAALKKQYEKL
jgi:hypothetical protein